MRANTTRTLKNLSILIFSNKEFFYNIAKILGKSAGTLGLLYFASKMDIPITLSQSGDVSTRRPIDQNIHFPNIIFSKNPQEAAIDGLIQMANNSSFDSNKMDYVKKIYKIASDGTDDHTQMVAIAAINSIIRSMSFSSSKQQASDYIYKLVT